VFDYAAIAVFDYAAIAVFDYAAIAVLTCWQQRSALSRTSASSSTHLDESL
jgi:hypothetical protein